MRRHPDAKVDADIQCVPTDGSWYCIVRLIEVHAMKPATNADVECALDIVHTFTGRDDRGNWKSQSSSMIWFDKGVNASSYDWRGGTREELAHAHEMDLPEREDWTRKA